MQRPHNATTPKLAGHSQQGQQVCGDEDGLDDVGAQQPVTPAHRWRGVQHPPNLSRRGSGGGQRRVGVGSKQGGRAWAPALPAKCECSAPPRPPTHRPVVGGLEQVGAQDGEHLRVWGRGGGRPARSSVSTPHPHAHTPPHARTQQCHTPHTLTNTPACTRKLHRCRPCHSVPAST